MAKLIALVLTFAAFVAFASAATTIVTTTTEDENPQQCSRQIQGERFNQCQRYLQQGQSWYEQDNRSQMLQSCCQELQNVEEQCQCEAVKEAFRQAQRMQQQQQQGQQGGSFGSQQMREMKQKAQDLPNQCKLQSRQCQVGSIISITTTTTITEEEEEDNTRGSQQMCQHIRGRRFNQCQSYIQRQISGYSGTVLLMSVSRKGQESYGVEQCCNELENVEEECQCEAMQEVYRQAQQMQMQRQQQGSRRQQGGRQTQDLQQVVQNLRNQCNLQAQQCRIPSAMF